MVSYFQVRTNIVYLSNYDTNLKPTLRALVMEISALPTIQINWNFPSDMLDVINRLECRSDIMWSIRKDFSTDMGEK